MASPTPPQLPGGLFLPTTYTFDVQEVRQIKDISPEFRELLVRMYQNLSNMLKAINFKENGGYFLTEYQTNQQYFANNTYPINRQQMRGVFRITVDISVPLPNATTLSIPHNIPFNNAYRLTNIFGAGTDPVGLTYIGLPYASPTLTNNIELFATATDIVIITGSNRSNFTLSQVTLEYLKN